MWIYTGTDPLALAPQPRCYGAMMWDTDMRRAAAAAPYHGASITEPQSGAIITEPSDIIYEWPDPRELEI